MTGTYTNRGRAERRSIPAMNGGGAVLVTHRRLCSYILLIQHHGMIIQFFKAHALIQCGGAVALGYLQPKAFCLGVRCQTAAQKRCGPARRSDIAAE